jgi:electron transfer flavoprotein alpha subunit
MTANRIWVVPQVREGQLSRISWEAVAAAQRLAAAAGGPGCRAEAVLVGADLAGVARQLAERDLAAVHVADDPALTTYTPGAMIGVLAPAIAQANPAYVVFPHTYQSVDFVPRLAQQSGAALLPEVTGFAAGPDATPASTADTASGAGLAGLVWTRPILGGKLQAQVRVRGAGTVLVSVQSGAFPADGVVPAAAAGATAATPAAEIRPLAVGVCAGPPDREVLGYEAVAAQQVDLTKADIIVAVGRGVGGADKLGPIEALARALGAEIGASRPVIDSGWLPRERQIGSSGQNVAPRLYIAAGISGAIQHLVGMKGSSVIVAINKDPGAPIFAVANYGVVGDLHEVVPALVEAVKAAKA